VWCREYRCVAAEAVSSAALGDASALACAAYWRDRDGLIRVK